MQLLDTFPLSFIAVLVYETVFNKKKSCGLVFHTEVVHCTYTVKLTNKQHVRVMFQSLIDNPCIVEVHSFSN